MNYDYKTSKRNRKPSMEGEYPVPDGTWLPISIAAHIAQISRQMVSLKINNNIAKTMKYPIGPKLVRVEDLFE